MKLLERKTKSGTIFYIQKTIEGKQRKFPVGNKRGLAKSRALRFELTFNEYGPKAAILELKGGKPLKKGDSPTFENIKAFYGEYLAQGKPLRPKTVYDNLAALKRIMTACGAEYIGQIDSQKVRPSMLPATPTPAQERGFSSTITCAKSIFKKKAMHFYELKGYKFTNPLEHVETSAPKIEPYTPVSSDTRERIRQNPAFDPQENLILLLGIECGLRRSEIEACRLSWFSEQEDRVFLSVQEGPNFKPKSGQKRMFPIDKELHAEMIELRSATNPTDDFFVFVDSKKGTCRLDRRFKNVNAWLKTFGVSGVQKLRAEAGSKVAQEAGIFEAQRVLGHSSPTVTANHYAGILNLKTVGGKLKIAPPPVDQAEAFAATMGLTAEELRSKLAKLS